MVALQKSVNQSLAISKHLQIDVQMLKVAASNNALERQGLSNQTNQLRMESWNNISFLNDQWISLWSDLRVSTIQNLSKQEYSLAVVQSRTTALEIDVALGRINHTATNQRLDQLGLVLDSNLSQTSNQLRNLTISVNDLLRSTASLQHLNNTIQQHMTISTERWSVHTVTLAGVASRLAAGSSTHFIT